MNPSERGIGAFGKPFEVKIATNDDYTGVARKHSVSEGKRGHGSSWSPSDWADKFTRSC